MSPQIDQLRNAIRQRRKRAKHLLKRLPRRSSVARYPVIGGIAARLQTPYFWKWKGWPLRAALYGGMVISLLPLMGVQIPLALAIAVLLRANLPVAVAIQFISNPFTAVPLYGLTYFTGSIPLDWLGIPLGVAWESLLALIIGGLVWGIIVAVALDAGINLIQRKQARDRQELIRLTHQLCVKRDCGADNMTMEARTPARP